MKKKLYRTPSERDPEKDNRFPTEPVAEGLIQQPEYLTLFDPNVKRQFTQIQLHLLFDLQVVTSGAVLEASLTLTVASQDAASGRTLPPAC